MTGIPKGPPRAAPPRATPPAGMSKPRLPAVQPAPGPAQDFGFLRAAPARTPEARGTHDSRIVPKAEPRPMPAAPTATVRFAPAPPRPDATVVAKKKKR